MKVHAILILKGVNNVCKKGMAFLLYKNKGFR